MCRPYFRRGNPASRTFTIRSSETGSFVYFLTLLLPLIVSKIPNFSSSKPDTTQICRGLIVSSFYKKILLPTRYEENVYSRLSSEPVRALKALDCIDRKLDSSTHQTGCYTIKGLNQVYFAGTWHMF